MRPGNPYNSETRSEATRPFLRQVNAEYQESWQCGPQFRGQRAHHGEPQLNLLFFHDSGFIFKPQRMKSLSQSFWQSGSSIYSKADLHHGRVLGYFGQVLGLSHQCLGVCKWFNIIIVFLPSLPSLTDQLGGCVGLGFGIYALVSNNDLGELIDEGTLDGNNSSNTAEIVLVSICGVVILITFLGCCGAIKVRMILFGRNSESFQCFNFKGKPICHLCLLLRLVGHHHGLGDGCDLDSFHYNWRGQRTSDQITWKVRSECDQRLRDRYYQLMGRRSDQSKWISCSWTWRSNDTFCSACLLWHWFIQWLDQCFARTLLLSRLGWKQSS